LEFTTTSQTNEIDQLETDIANNASNIVAINNSFTATTDLLRTDLNSETTNRTSADSSLQSNIDSEAATRLASDNTLQSNIDAEKVLRENADVILQANIDSEVLSRTLDVSGINASISSEISARFTANALLQSNIDAESTARTVSILAESTRALASEGVLQSNTIYWIIIVLLVICITANIFMRPFSLFKISS